VSSGIPNVLSISDGVFSPFCICLHPLLHYCLTLYIHDVNHVRFSFLDHGPRIVALSAQSVMMSTFVVEVVTPHAASPARVGVANLDIQVRDVRPNHLGHVPDISHQSL
jgi:hypothetical protein